MLPKAERPRAGGIQEFLELSGSQQNKRRRRVSCADLSKLACVDYRKRLRERFSRTEILLLVQELRSFLPALNRRVFSELDLKRLAQTAESFGAALHVNTFDGEEGCTLRGFYVNDSTVLKRPLIVLNGANNSISVAASFWHEMGHHLTHAIFGRAHDRVRLPFSASYDEHLSAPDEFAADLVMVFGGYPKPAAERLFGRKSGPNGRLNAELLLKKARQHLRTVAKLYYVDDLSSGKDLWRIAGMLHLAKLREALLHEYGI